MDVQHFASNLTELEKSGSRGTPQEQSAESRNREPLVNPQSYYRSKAFTINVDINPLIAAAAPLLILANKLHQAPISPDLNKLHQDLTHEIKAFENKTQTLGYRPHIILAARYTLCTLLDEMVMTSAWGPQSDWSNQNLLATFQGEIWGGERFFLILERGCEDPKLHIDLLELIYLCLSFGFQGKYRLQDQGYIELGKIIDNLYHIIRKHRGEFFKNLLIHSDANYQPLKPRHWLPRWIIIFLAITLTISFYTYINHHLKTESNSIYQSLQQLIDPNGTMSDKL